MGMNVGFIGIGGMGAAMVPHLVAGGHAVRAWNRNRAAAEALQGVEVVDSPVAAFDADVVFTMLSDDRAIRQVVIDSGALAVARQGCVHVMMATISPALVRELMALHQAAGIAYVSAPVFGVPAAAAQAQLNILAAGPSEALAKARPLLDLMGRKTWLLGEDPVQANIAKIAGNMMITMAIEAMGEATALTQGYGLAAGDFLDIVTNTIFASPSYQRYGGFIARDTYEPGFKLSLGLKDVDLALDAAKANGTVMPSADIVRENMQAAVDKGWSAKDWSILAKVARQRAGLADDVA